MTFFTASHITRDVMTRIEASLNIKNSSYKRKFWYGFITALVDYDIITHREHQWVRDNIHAHYGR